MTSPFNPVPVLVKKRKGQRLSREEIQGFVHGFVRGEVADYQMSAWLMAVVLNGMSLEETVDLTDAMLHSGKVLRLGSVPHPRIDKHSTGGVGDKISLCLAPLVAACGVAVPMISGRGLGHTGGTLDKLESIPGYRTELSEKEFERIVRRAGVCLMGQTAWLAPADRAMYALRDVTGTVESVPLIVASILSKKLASGLDGLVLDVKVGRGAFMPDLTAARRLAKSLVAVGQRAGKKVVALLTNMDAPIGLTIGNALELKEALDVLCGAGPEDTIELTVALGAEMLTLAGVVKTRAEGRRAIQRRIDDGTGVECFRRMVEAQGGDPGVIDDPSRLPATRHRVPVLAPKAGVVAAIDSRALGLLSIELGAGRTRADQTVDHAVGIELGAQVGQTVQRDQPIAWLHVRSQRGKERLVGKAGAAFSIGRRKPKVTERVLGRVTR